MAAHSPFELLQERVGPDPWRNLMVSIFLNNTPAVRAEPVLWRFFDRYPTAQSACDADVRWLEDVGRPLGLSARRARTIVELSVRYLRGDWDSPSDLPGVGRYGADSYSIFVEGRLDTQPTDKKLAKYVEWRCALDAPPLTE